MKYKEVSFVLGCIFIIFVGGFFLLPKVFKEFQDEDLIRVRVSLENKCSITDDAFVVLDESTKIKTPFYGTIAVLRTQRNAPLRLWMSPNFPQFRYDGEIQRAEDFLADEKKKTFSEIEQRRRLCWKPYIKVLIS